jgi:CBS domain-containing protein
VATRAAVSAPRLICIIERLPQSGKLVRLLRRCEQSETHRRATTAPLERARLRYLPGEPAPAPQARRTAMKKLSYKVGAGIGFAVLSRAVLAATVEDELATVIKGSMYAFLVFVIVVIVGVYFMRWQDKRRAPLSKLLQDGEAIHSVAPDAPITECVRLMNAKKIGALVVIDGEKLVGIFTERDALTRVLAGALDPRTTKVSEVMTKDPYCIAPTASVGEAMELVTQRRFRHLPIVENEKLLAVLSSGDLTRWMVEDQAGEIRQLVGLVARS